MKTSWRNMRIDGPMDELLKDADVIDHCFKDASKPVKEKEQKRYDALCKGLGLQDNGGLL